MMELVLPLIDNFTPTGDGSNDAWKTADWHSLKTVGDGLANYATRAKAVYSSTGIYFVVECDDTRLTCSYTEPMSDLFLEDVVEIFLWPDEEQVVYFEYEISPLNVELALLVANTGSEFYGWLPWHFSNERQTHKAVTVRGGSQTSDAEVEGWTAEFYIPFALLTGLRNVPPQPGSRWRGNIYRIDYDVQPMSQWAFSPETGGNFHDYQHFATLIFGDRR
jgi:hypothetical protein